MTYSNEELTIIVNQLDEITTLLKEIVEKDGEHLDNLEKRLARLERAA